MLALFVILTAATLAAADFSLTVPGQGPYKLWTTADRPQAAPKDAELVEKNPTDVKAPATGFVAVLDTQTGNLAVKNLKGLKGSVTLTEADFSLIGEVQVEITHNGQPVQAAHVTLTDGAGSKSAELDSTMKGDVSFYGVKQGHVDVKVQYASNGAQATPLDLVADLDAQRPQTTPVVKASIADDVATVAPAGSTVPMPGQENAAPGTTPPPKEQLTASTILGKTAAILFGIVLFGAIVYLFYWLWKAHPTAVAEKLTALGVQIPKDPNEAMDAGPIQPAAPIKPEPLQKIILENSEPTPLMAGPAAPAAPAVPAGPPGRLVADSGASLSVPDGTTMIGREATLGVALADPSTLSRRHAELVRQGDQLAVRDLGSTNGTYVNGRKIDADTPLHVGDVVQFGAVRFRVEP